MIIKFASIVSFYKQIYNSTIPYSLSTEQFTKREYTDKEKSR